MSGILGGFVRSMKQRCKWSKKQTVGEWGKAAWGEGKEIPCIFFPERQISVSRLGGVIEIQAKFFVKAEHEVTEGDKLEYRERVYIIEHIKNIEWFGGRLDGYKCLCRQEGGVAV